MNPDKTTLPLYYSSDSSDSLDSLDSLDSQKSYESGITDKESVDGDEYFLDNNNNPIDCPICLDHIENSEILVTPCFHAFHKNCFYNYCSITSKGKPVRCPVCNVKSVDKQEIASSCNKKKKNQLWKNEKYKEELDTVLARRSAASGGKLSKKRGTKKQKLKAKKQKSRKQKSTKNKSKSIKKRRTKRKNIN